VRPTQQKHQAAVRVVRYASLDIHPRKCVCGVFEPRHGRLNLSAQVQIVRGTIFYSKPGLSAHFQVSDIALAVLTTWHELVVSRYESIISCSHAAHAPRVSGLRIRSGQAQRSKGVVAQVGVRLASPIHCGWETLFHAPSQG
jgi:hypothetical protein